METVRRITQIRSFCQCQFWNLENAVPCAFLCKILLPDGTRGIQKVSISGFLSENAPSVHPDIGHQIFLYEFWTFILPDLRINSPIVRVG